MRRILGTTCWATVPIVAAIIHDSVGRVHFHSVTFNQATHSVEERTRQGYYLEIKLMPRPCRIEFLDNECIGHDDLACTLADTDENGRREIRLKRRDCSCLQAAAVARTRGGRHAEGWLQSSWHC